MGPGFGPGQLVSNVGGGDALDAADSLDTGEGVLEFASDHLVVCVEEELSVDLLESEDVLADLGLLDLDAGGNCLGDGCCDGCDVSGVPR